VVWDEATAAYQTISTLEFPSQDVLSAQREVFWKDAMELTLWDGLVAHQPLGSIDRLRKTVYEMSKKKREAVNATPIKAVNSVNEMPSAS